MLDWQPTQLMLMISLSLSLSLSLYMGDGTGVPLDRFLHLQAKKRDTTRKHLGCPFCSFEDTASD